MGKDGELVCRHKEGNLSGYFGVSSTELYTRARRRFIRQIKEIDHEKEVDTFKRFALLPNVDGQKYTFGNNSFIKLEEQREFIFLSEFSKGVEEGRSLFEVEVDERKFYITPISPRSGTVRLNDAQLLKQTELKFGDALNFGDKSKPLLFVERELRPEMFLYSKAAVMAKYKENDERSRTKILKPDSTFIGEFTLGQNGLIMSLILSHLPLEDVKNCRLVSKLWAEEGIKTFRKECILSLDFRWDNVHVPQPMKLFRYFHEMGNNHPLQNWSLILPAFSAKEDEYRIVCKAKGMPGAKLLSDLDFYLFKRKISAVHQLELGGDIFSKFDYKLRLKILRTFQDTLTELTLAGAWRIVMEKTGPKITFPDNLSFPNLQTFTLDMNDMEGRYIVQDCSNMTWFRDLVLSITSVTSIRVKSEEQTAGPFLEYLCQNSALFSNLQEIKLLFVISPIVTPLLKLEKSLKKLELWNCNHMNLHDFPLLTELLSKHSNSLEKLVMNFPNDNYGEKWTTPVVINFPAMHKLRFLSLGFWNETGHLKVNFPGGIINYGKDFPCLKSLKLRPRKEKWYKSVYEMFFPILNKNHSDTVEDEELCTSLQILNLDPINFKVYDASLPNGSKNVPIFTPSEILNIATMFPNVSNGDWIEARKSPVVEEIKEQEQELGPRKLRPRSVGGANQLKGDRKK